MFELLFQNFLIMIPYRTVVLGTILQINVDSEDVSLVMKFAAI